MTAMMTSLTDSFDVSSSPTFLPIAVSSTPKMSVRRDARLWRAELIFDPKIKDQSDVEERDHLKDT